MVRIFRVPMGHMEYLDQPPCLGHQPRGDSRPATHVIVQTFPFFLFFFYKEEKTPRLFPGRGLVGAAPSQVVPARNRSTPSRPPAELRGTSRIWVHSRSFP